MCTVIMNELQINHTLNYNLEKIVRIRSYYDLYFPEFELNAERSDYTDQNNSEYGHFLRSVFLKNQMIIRINWIAVTRYLVAIISLNFVEYPEYRSKRDFLVTVIV